MTGEDKDDKDMSSGKTSYLDDFENKSFGLAYVVS